MKNWICPRILYFYNFRPHAQRNLPFFIPFFHISHDFHATGGLFPSDSRMFFHRCSLAVRLSTLPSGCRRLEHLFSQVSPLIQSFFFTIVAPVLILTLSFLNDHASCQSLSNVHLLWLFCVKVTV
jgi:hypothetical protein